MSLTKHEVGSQIFEYQVLKTSIVYGIEVCIQEFDFDSRGTKLFTP